MKYADDMAIIGLLNHRGSDKVYHDFIESFSVFCKNNDLLINSSKTKEMVVNFSRTVTTDVVLANNSVFIDNYRIETVSNFKYLGTIF